MEIASNLIRGLRVGGETVSDEQLACAAWPRSVGNYTARHTRAARMVRERLVVEAYQAGNPKPPVPRGSAERGRQAEGGPARPRNMLPQSQLVRNRKALGRFSHREAWMHRVGSA